MKVPINTVEDFFKNYVEEAMFDTAERISEARLLNKKYYKRTVAVIMQELYSKYGITNPIYIIPRTLK